RSSCRRGRQAASPLQALQERGQACPDFLVGDRCGGKISPEEQGRFGSEIKPAAFVVTTLLEQKRSSVARFRLGLFRALLSVFQTVSHPVRCCELATND